MEVPVRTNDHHSIVVQIGFLWVGYFDKILKKHIIMRRMFGCDGYGVLQAKRSAKKKILNLKIKDPKSFAAKIMVEYNSRAVS